MYPAKTAGPIELLFDAWIRGVTRNCVLDGDPGWGGDEGDEEGESRVAQFLPRDAAMLARSWES